MVRYKGKDELGVRYHTLNEANFGTFDTTKMGAYISPVIEVIPTFDPEINPIYCLRTGDVAGEPIALLSRRKNVRLRLTWIQQNMEVQYYNFLQHFLLKDGPLFEGAELTNLCLEAQIKRDASNLFFLKFTGLKANLVTVRGSIGEPVTWMAEMIGKSMVTTASMNFDSWQNALATPPWMWKDYYVEYDIGAGWVLFPDVTDFEFRFEKNLKPNFCFNSGGSLELVSLEEMEYRVTARLTANLTSKTFLDALLAETETKLRLLGPSATITNETFNSGTLDTAVSLAHRNIRSSPAPVVTNTAETVTYTEGTDYTIDYNEGKITCLSTGSMAANTGYLIDYTYGVEVVLTGGKFRAAEPTLRPEDLIAQRIEYIAKSYTHNF